MRVNGHDRISTADERARVYCSYALSHAVESVLGAGAGERNETLNNAAYGLARLIQTGALSESEIRDQLTQAALNVGLSAREIASTLKSAIRSGLADPREIPQPSRSTSAGSKPKVKPSPSKPKQADKRPVLDLDNYVAQCTPADPDHGYLTRKGMAPDGLLKAAPLTVAGRNVAGWLAVPAYGLEGELATIQFINADGNKLSAPGHQIGCAVFVVNGSNGRPTPSVLASGEIILVEGIGTADAAFKATGKAAIVTFGKGNLDTVAKALRQRHPNLRITIAPDVGAEETAERICSEIGAPSGWCPMPEGWPANSDLNDLAAGEDGHDLVRRVLEDVRQPRSVTSGIPVKRMGEIKRNPQTRWAVGNMIPQDIVGEIVAPSTAGKSLLITDIGAHIALGQEWQGNYVEQGAVLFLVGEGENGLGKRRQAWEIVHGVNLDLAPFYFIDVVPNMLAHEDVQAVIEAVLAIHKLTPVRMVVVDTKSQHTAGQPEDDNAITAAFIRNLIDIRKATGAAVLYTHHTGHSNQERGRGASSAFANVDLSILMQPNERGVVIKTMKAKDWLPHKPIQAVVRAVELGYYNDQTGEHETSAVLDYLDYAPSAKPSHMDELLQKALAQSGTNSRETVRKAFYGLHKGEAEAAKKAFNRSWSKYMNEQLAGGAK